MNCNFVESHLADYLNGDLGPETSQEFRWHLARCEKCRHIGSDALHIIRNFLAARPADSQYTAT